MNARDRSYALERIATGVAGLDTVLGGGLLGGGLYIVQGAPGTGKTILANQISFHQAQRNRRVVYLTLMAEAHDRMLLHLRGLTFADPSLLPDPLYYASAYAILEEEGLPGLSGLVRELARKRCPAVVVLDGLYVAHERSESDREFRRFVYELQGEAALRNITFLFLNNGPTPKAGAEHTMVDGLIDLRDELVGARAVRTLQVTKFRGSAHLRGRHLFRIREEGIVVYPRLEALVAGAPEGGGAAPGRVSIGAPGLDRMLGGGVPAGSTTLVAGPTGNGKTSVGLLFLGAATPDEPGLLFGCYESEAELLVKARALGIEVDRSIREGAWRVVWQRPFETSLDEMAHRLLEALAATGARRLVVDGIGAFRHTALHPERLGAFVTALSLRLRARNVTTLATIETEGLFRPQDLSLSDVSAAAENILLLRLAEHESRLVRMLSVLKMRRSGFDPAVVPFEITDRGIAIGAPLSGAEGILAGPGPDAGARPRR